MPVLTQKLRQAGRLQRGDDNGLSAVARPHEIAAEAIDAAAVGLRRRKAEAAERCPPLPVGLRRFLRERLEMEAARHIRQRQVQPLRRRHRAGKTARQLAPLNLPTADLLPAPNDLLQTRTDAHGAVYDNDRLIRQVIREDGSVVVRNVESAARHRRSVREPLQLIAEHRRVLLACAVEIDRRRAPDRRGDQLEGGREHNALQRRCGALRRGVKTADGVYYVAKELKADGALRMGGPDIDDAAAAAHGAGRLNCRHRLIPKRNGVGEDVLNRDRLANSQSNGLVAEGIGRHGDRRGRVGAGDDERGRPRHNLLQARLLRGGVMVRQGGEGAQSLPRRRGIVGESFIGQGVRLRVRNDRVGRGRRDVGADLLKGVARVIGPGVKPQNRPAQVAPQAGDDVRRGPLKRIKQDRLRLPGAQRLNQAAVGGSVSQAVREHGETHAAALHAAAVGSTPIAAAPPIMAAPPATPVSIPASPLFLASRSILKRQKPRRRGHVPGSL